MEKKTILSQTWLCAQCILYELQPIRIVDVVDASKFIYKFSTDLGSAGMIVSDYGYQKLYDWIISLSYTTWLCISLWMLGWAVMIYADFGSLWIVLSMISSIFLNLGERKKGELSAYSVFNEGFKQLLGTMDAQQFDNEIRHNMHPRRGARHIVQLDDVLRADFSDDDDFDDAQGEIRQQDRRNRRQLRRQQQQQPQQQRQRRHNARAGANNEIIDDQAQLAAVEEQHAAAEAGGPAPAAVRHRKGKKSRRNYEERTQRRDAAQQLLQQELGEELMEFGNSEEEDVFFEN